MEGNTHIRIQAKRLTGFQLKRIAVVSMIMDHAGAILMDGALRPYRTGEAILFTGQEPFLIRNAFVIKDVCNALGAAAFPIFCFLIAEGVRHTKNRMNYALRMLLFALISELPFNLAHRGTLLYPGLQNVMFTLTIGILTLWGISCVESRLQAKPFIRWISTGLIALLGACLAFAVRSEYVFLGIAAMALFYLFREHRYLKLLGVVPLLVASPFALLALPAILLYGGERGRGNPSFFYVFYPAHFLLFYGLGELLARI